MNKNGFVVINKESIPDLSVKVSGKRGDLIQGLDDARVNIDLSEITAAGDYDLTGIVQLPNSKLSLEKRNFSTVPITIDEYISKEIQLKVRIVGTGGEMFESVPAHETITIKGAKSELKAIAGAYVTVDAEEVKESGEMSREIILSDSEGNALEKPESVDMDEYIVVTNTLYKKVTLPITVKLSDELDAELDLSATEINPSTIEVGVLPDTEISEVIALLTDLNSDEPKVELLSVPGLFIPDNVKTVKVKPVIKQEE